MTLDRIDEVASKAFEGYVVRKDLVRKLSRLYPVPTYVVEFLLGRYCASTDPEEIEEGLKLVQEQLGNRTVRAGEEELFKAKAREKGTHVGIYADRILGGPLPWTKMRQAYALLSLCEKYGEGRVEAMCQSALAFDVVNVSKVAAMLKSAAKAPRPTSGKVVQLPLPRFARPSEHFETRSPESKSTKEGI